MKIPICIVTALAATSLLAQEAPSIFVVGDSTARNVDRRGWGDPFADYFDPAKVNVVNRARAGRSARTFLTEGLWGRVLDDLKPGDYVLIQFGHNVGGAPDRDRARGDLPGLGDESQEFTLPDGKRELVHTFGWYIRKFVNDAKAKGATPVLLSCTVRNIWKDGRVERALGQFGNWSAAVARQEQVSFVDVGAIIADKYEQMGEDKVKELFPQDHTHTSQAGADLNASLVIAGLKALPNSPVNRYFSAKGQAVAAAGARTTGQRVPLPLPEPADPKLPTLWLIGDSTVRNGRGDGANGQWGWGEPLVAFFDPAKINVVNRAVGGLSSRTYLTQGQWDRVMAMMKSGDFVVMQFGHNDGGPLSDNSRARGTIPGTGEETREIDNPLTKQHEVVHTYGWYLRKFIEDARAKGATPMVCSPIPRKTWKAGKIQRSRETYAGWAAAVAEAEKAPFIDLNETIARQYDDLGPEKVDPLFGDEHTHTSRAGAELNAATVIAGLQAVPGNSLGPYFLNQTKTPRASFKFDFGNGPPAPGYTKVTSSTMYTDELGYGLEPGSTPQSIERGIKNPLQDDFLTSDRPFYFSVKVPEEGNYKVTVTLGDRAGESTTTVKAELRRLMLARVHTNAGQFETRTFLVNVRNAKIAGGGEVRLKDREKTSEVQAWDAKLTLEFTDTRPAIGGVEIEKDDRIPTIYIAGDSTSTDQPREPFNSWGQMLTVFFKPEIAIANHGESGESLRGFINEKRLDKLTSLMKPGDWLFVQMGHNDQKEKGEGVGAFTTYKANLKRFISEARQHGATPVLITPMHRLTFGEGGKIVNSLGDYPEAVRQTAKVESVALIDLNAMSVALYEALGPRDAHQAFAGNDTTHHDNYGSYELAKCIVQGIKDDNLAIARYLYPTPKFDPAHPDPVDRFDLPAEPHTATLTPYGR